MLFMLAIQTSELCTHTNYILYTVDMLTSPLVLTTIRAVAVVHLTKPKN